MEKKIYSFVDVLKFVFSYFIIMIHVDLFNDVNESLHYFSANILTRIAVPFFFAVSGFFFAKSLDYSKERKIAKTKSNLKRLKKTEWRIIVLYAVWSFIYVFIAMPFNYDGWSISNLADYAITSVIRCSFYHLWYIYALDNVGKEIWFTYNFVDASKGVQFSIVKSNEVITSNPVDLVFELSTISHLPVSSLILHHSIVLI